MSSSRFLDRLNNVNNVSNDSSAATRRFLVAFCASLLVHVVCLSKFGVWSVNVQATSALQVSLVSPATTDLVASAAHASNVSDVLSASPQPIAAQTPDVPALASASQAPGKPQATRDGLVTPQESEVPAPASAPATPPKPTAAPASSAQPAAARPVAAEPVISPAAPAQESSPTEQTVGLPRPWTTGQPKRVDLEFEIFSGANRQLLGVGRHHYLSEDGEYYGVSVKQTLSPEDAEHEEQWQLSISGRINKQGLSPLLFQMQGLLPERLMALKEVSETPLTLRNQARHGRIPDGILDRQSLLYQFMRLPPAAGGGKLWLTDGAKNGLYTYRVAGSESLHIAALGDVRTLQVVLSASDSSEIIELWLLPDFHYLPAKMRHSDGRGTLTEQLVTAINFE